MIKEFINSIFIFRRDLRLADNTALLQALQSSEVVIPIFIFDDRQINNNPYRGDNLIQFMLESLVDLDEQLQEFGAKLFCFQGEPERILANLIESTSAQAVFFNKDYTPFSIKRDAALVQTAHECGCVTRLSDDALLNAPGTVLKADGKPYLVFTPFFKAAKQIPVAVPQQSTNINFYKGHVVTAKQISDIDILHEHNEYLFVHGGRRVALALLDRVGDLKDYKTSRDLPAVRGTTGLSAHNKFGTLSVREVYHTVARLFGAEHTIINELYWRDFFTHIGFHFPHVFSGCFHTKYDQIEWDNNHENFQSWCEGRTGFPLVDAGMRELNATGFMHNRVRMLVASFLVKDLHIDWRWGEKYFAQKLIDYDPAVNNGNWQWAASTGCDAQPYFRVFSPWRQLERFDPQCLYVKHWLPELRSLSASEILKLEKQTLPIGYIAPIVDHRQAKEEAEDLFRACSA